MQFTDGPFFVSSSSVGVIAFDILRCHPAEIRAAAWASSFAIERGRWRRG
jgi:hypothetical protein